MIPILFKNRINLKICEIVLQRFEKTKFSAFNSYCYLIKRALENGNLTAKQTQDIFIILEMLNELFNFNDADAFEYVYDFFIEENYKSFGEVVKLTEIYFPNVVFNKQIL